MNNFLDCVVKYEKQSEAPLNRTLESMFVTAGEIRSFAEAYLESRFVSQSPDASEEALQGTLMHAVARLHWILNSGRQEISNIFTEEEFIQLLSCFQGELMSPQNGSQIATTLCYDAGIELEDYENSSLANLIDRLCSLNTVQAAALMDALEVWWHSGSNGFAALKDMNLQFK